MVSPLETSRDYLRGKLSIPVRPEPMWATKGGQPRGNRKHTLEDGATTGASLEKLQAEGQAGPATKRRKAATTCKCGSTTHTRTSAKDCPLNPKKEKGAGLPANGGAAAITTAPSATLEQDIGAIVRQQLQALLEGQQSGAGEDSGDESD